MSDFFGGITNIRQPEVVMNSGPLPPLNTDGLPYGLNGTADARINYGSTLLGDVNPYVYGDSDRLSTQTSYLNVPHRIQKTIPMVYLPGLERENAEWIPVSHPVDMGDVVWSLRLRNISNVLGVHMKSAEGLDDNGTNLTAFVNISTMNYILFGFQHYVTTSDESLKQTPCGKQWSTLWNDFFKGFQAAELVRSMGISKNPEDVHRLLYLVSMLARPFGICMTSEKQGGQHEANFGPVMWAVNFVSTLTVDGLNRDMINYWKHVDINSGDKLCFRLMKARVPTGQVFVLNHYYKQMVRVMNTLPEKEVYLFVPDILPFSLRYNALDKKAPFGVFCVHQIAQVQQHVPKTKSLEDMNYFMDDTVNLRGGLLQTTFSPVYMAVQITDVNNDFKIGTAMHLPRFAVKATEIQKRTRFHVSAAARNRLSQFSTPITAVPTSSVAARSSQESTQERETHQSEPAAVSVTKKKAKVVGKNANTDVSSIS